MDNSQPSIDFIDDDGAGVVAYFPVLFPLEWGKAGQHELTLVKPSEALDIKAELGLPTNAPAAIVTLEAPFGRTGYTYKVFATYDNKVFATYDNKVFATYDNKVFATYDKLHGVHVILGTRFVAVPPISIVIWWRRVYCHGSAAYLEARGDFRTGNTPISLYGLDKVGMREAQRALEGLPLFKKIERRGRPRGTASFQNAEDFQAKVLPIMCTLLREGRHPTQEAVALHFGTRTSDRQIRTWLRQFHLRWNDLLQLASNEPSRKQFSS